MIINIMSNLSSSQILHNCNFFIKKNFLHFLLFLYKNQIKYKQFKFIAKTVKYAQIMEIEYHDLLTHLIRTQVPPRLQSIQPASLHPLSL